VFGHDKIIRIVLHWLYCIMCNSYSAFVRRITTIMKIFIAVVKCLFSHHIYIGNECRLI